jgi:hypothetical protein
LKFSSDVPFFVFVKSKNTTYKEISTEFGRSELWLANRLSQNIKFSEDEVTQLCAVLNCKRKTIFDEENRIKKIVGLNFEKHNEQPEEKKISEIENTEPIKTNNLSFEQMVKSELSFLSELFKKNNLELKDKIQTLEEQMLELSKVLNFCLKSYIELEANKETILDDLSEVLYELKKKKQK